MPAQDLRGFSEKVALVTGAGSGIGRAVALQLAMQGVYVVAVHGREVDAETARAIEELRSLGTLAHTVEADVTERDGVEAAIAAVEAAYGRLDLLVNALALDAASDSLWWEQDWDGVIATVLRSAFLCTRVAAPLLQVRPSPAVVSVAARSDSALAVAEATAAAGLAGMTRALARELGPKIRVNCVLAGMSANGEPVAATDVARSVVYLLSSDAKTITGQTLTVGGA
jgi:3-oxoacyl-[acyl-carrier protein] reductase